MKQTQQSKALEYDANNNLRKETKGSQTMSYGYNEINQLTSVNLVSNGVSTEQSYGLDAIGKLAKVFRNDIEQVDVKYTKNSLPDLVTFTNGIVTDPEYDNAQQLKTLSVTKGASSLLSESCI